MSNFRKSEDCPPSAELLGFQLGQLPESERIEIRRHLNICEFCVAEVEFYSHYPQPSDRVAPEPIPPPLFELATALLRRERRDPAWLERLLHLPQPD